MRLPGEGTIYLEQYIRFHRPLHLDAPFQVRVQVVELDAARAMAKLETTSTLVSTQAVLMSGWVKVLLPTTTRPPPSGVARAGGAG